MVDIEAPPAGSELPHIDALNATCRRVPAVGERA
jgi:hypothetical protein